MYLPSAPPSVRTRAPSPHRSLNFSGLGVEPEASAGSSPAICGEPVANLSWWRISESNYPLLSWPAKNFFYVTATTIKNAINCVLKLIA